MHYDPVKDSLAAVIRKFPVLRVLFYKMLDILFLRSWFVRSELRRIRYHFKNKKIAILDAGSGYGQYTYHMATNLQPNTIRAIDVKEKWIEDCKYFFKKQNLNDVSFGVEDLTKINYENQFDLITCVDVMEHIEDDTTVFKNFYTALKEGGFLLINSPSTFGGSDVHEDEDESFIGEHFRDGYSFEDLQNKLEPIGFSFYSSRYTYGIWGDKAWRLGIKYPMQLLNISKIFFLILPVYYLFTFPITLILMYMDFRTISPTGSGINIIVRK